MGQFELSRTRVSLFQALLRARRAKGGKTPILEDHERRVLTYDDIVLAAFALAGKIEDLTRPREIVGVMLPTGAGCAVTFFALHAAGLLGRLLRSTRRDFVRAAGRILTQGPACEDVFRLLPIRADVAFSPDEVVAWYGRIRLLVRALRPITLGIGHARADDDVVVLRMAHEIEIAFVV